MSTVDTCPTFWGGPCDLVVFLERLEQYFSFNDIADNKRRPLLLLAIDVYTHKTLQQLCHPQRPKDKTYEEIVALLKDHFVGRKSVFRERVKFYTERQHSNDSVAEWFARIKTLSVDCKFGEQVNSIVLDRFVSGLRATSILDRLFKEDVDLTIDKAVEIALSIECLSNGQKND